MNRLSKPQTDYLLKAFKKMKDAKVIYSGTMSSAQKNFLISQRKQLLGRFNSLIRKLENRIALKKETNNE